MLLQNTFFISRHKINDHFIFLTYYITMPCGKLHATIEGFGGGASQRTPVATRVWSGYPFGYHHEGQEPIRKLRKDKKAPNRFVVPGVPPVPSTIQQKYEGFVDTIQVTPIALSVIILIATLLYLKK